MATTKKTSARKKPTAKGKLAKAKPLTWKFYVVTVGIFLVAVSAVVVIGLFASNIVSEKNSAQRLDRIQGIYASLQLDDTYVPQDIDIFGDKRTYEWDKGRTYSSAIRYAHGDTVSVTVEQLDAKIKSAGFEFIDEPYPGSVYYQYHYKSAKGEYIRLTVSSKPYDDAVLNGNLMNKGEIPADVYDMDKNAGPANVVIKVNLDDNNE